MCRVAARYGKSPFDPDFLEQWTDFDKRCMLEASLEIEFDIDIITRSVAEALPKLLKDLANIVGTNIFNALVSKKDRVKYLVKEEKSGSSSKGDKVTIPGIGTVNILKDS